MISINFESFYFRETGLDLDEFDEKYGFCFVEQTQAFDIDHLIPFCEYIYDFVLRFEGHYFFVQINKHFYLQQINKVIEAIGYIESREDESSTVKTRVVYPLPRPGIRKNENKKETLYYKTNFERLRPSGAEQTFGFGRSHSIFVQIRHK